MTTKQVETMAKAAGIEAAADTRYVALTNGSRQVIIDTKYDTTVEAVKQKMARVI